MHKTFAMLAAGAALLAAAPAFAQVRFGRPTAVLTDYMQLLKTPDGWKIVHKIFDVAPKAKPAS